MKRAIIFMGVSGCGKTTVASAFAESIGGRFLDGDDFHPPENVAKMSKSVPLDDEDRAGWISALADAIAAADEAVLCIACSALKKKYRDRLRAAGGADEVVFVYLTGSRELLEKRLSERSGHFMPPGLLDSQLADLEDPVDALEVDIAQQPDVIVAAVRQGLGF